MMITPFAQFLAVVGALTLGKWFARLVIYFEDKEG